MTPRFDLPREVDLAPEQVMDLARRRWVIEQDLMGALDQAEADRRNAERDARHNYTLDCAAAHRTHRERLTQVEALALEARLEAQQLAAGGR